MKAYTNKIDFYRGRYKEQRIKNVCSLEGESDDFIELITLLINERSRYVSYFFAAVFIPVKDLLSYLVFVSLLTKEDSLYRLIQLVYRIRKLPMNSITSRVIKNPDTDLVESISKRRIGTYLSGIYIQSSFDSYLSQLADQESIKFLSDSCFFDDRLNLLKTFCIQRGWSNESINNLSFIFSSYKNA